jgi:cyanophycinase
MLVLVGSGEYLAPIEPMDRTLISRLNAPAKVVCLPTAAGNEGPHSIKYWSDLGVNHFTKLGASAIALPVIDRASASNEIYAQQICDANFVYLSGGKPDYLYKTLKDTIVWSAILSVLGNGGVVAGCSAGAMIMGEQFPGFPSSSPAFGLVPGIAVIPHFDEIPSMMGGLSGRVMGGGMIVVGVEGNTALVQTGDPANGNATYEVLGTGGVTIMKGGQRTRYTQGPIPNSALVKAK